MDRNEDYVMSYPGPPGIATCENAFIVPARVATAFNTVGLLRDIQASFLPEGREGRSLMKSEAECYTTCLRTISQYVSGEMSYGDPVPPTSIIPSDLDPNRLCVPAPTTANTMPRL